VAIFLCLKFVSGLLRGFFISVCFRSCLIYLMKFFTFAISTDEYIFTGLVTDGHW
jgi:hypothetical protein